MIPKNLNEAIAALDIELIEADKMFLLEHTATIVHTTLGRWIRNEWGLWQDSELAQYCKKLGYKHPDDMSNYIIEKYIEHLKNIIQK